METLTSITKKSIDKVIRSELTPICQAFRAFMAGFYISMGALFMTVVKCDASLPSSVSALLSGIVFSLGLILVIVCDGELFTGNCLMFIGVLENKITILELGRLLWNTLVWNIIGCFAAACFATITDINVDIFQTIMSTKRIVNTPMIIVFGKGVFCNVLVCLAIWMTSIPSCRKIEPLFVIMPVAMFVSCGFEHSIADIFMMLFLNPGVIPISKMLIFLAVVIIGNIFGGFFISFLLKSCYE